MANITVFDPVTGNSKTIVVIIDEAVLSTDNDGDKDWFLRFSTSATTVGGDPVPVLTHSASDDLVLGSTQYDGVTSTAYSDLKAGINDYVLRMVKGIPGDSDSAMDFS
jgi:hypothetical protein